MDAILNELANGFPDADEAARVGLRLLASLLFGAVIGLQREMTGKAAGLRTHILVSVGTAVIVVASAEVNMQSDAMSRVVQGLVTGIGFLGAGSILKLTTEQQIRGLTTAAGIWMTAAIGVACGLGRYGLALASTLVAWIVLAGLLHVERRLDNGKNLSRRELNRDAGHDSRQETSQDVEE